MLQALQGSKGQLYKMKCRNFTVMRVKLLIIKHLTTDTRHRLQGFKG